MQKVWIWFRSYWYIPVAVLVAIVSAIFMLSDNPGTKWIKEIIASYRKEIEVIETIDAAKEKEKAALQEKYETSIAMLERGYAEQSKVLDEKKKARVRELVGKYKNDEAGLTDAFAKEFGLKVEK
jgi:hypothetical protein